MANPVTVDVRCWEACRTLEEAAAHEDGCLKMGVEAGGERRCYWLCTSTCDAPDEAVATASERRLARVKAWLAEEGCPVAAPGLRPLRFRERRPFGKIKHRVGRRGGEGTR